MSAIITYPDTRNMFADSKKITLDKINQRVSGGSSGGSGGGGSGSSLQQIYLNRNPAAPDDPTKPAASYNTATQVITWWNLTTWE